MLSDILNDVSRSPCITVLIYLILHVSQASSKRLFLLSLFSGSDTQPGILIQSDAPLQKSHGVLIITLTLVNMALIIVFAGFIYWKRGMLLLSFSLSFTQFDFKKFLFKFFFSLDLIF